MPTRWWLVEWVGVGATRQATPSERMVADAGRHRPGVGSPGRGGTFVSMPAPPPRACAQGERGRHLLEPMRRFRRILGRDRARPARNVRGGGTSRVIPRTRTRISTADAPISSHRLATRPPPGSPIWAANPTISSHRLATRPPPGPTGRPGDPACLAVTFSSRSSHWTPLETTSATVGRAIASGRGEPSSSTLKRD
jgi:hypothetical protein